MTYLQQPARLHGFAAPPDAGAASILSFAPGDTLPDRTLLVASGWAGCQRRLPDGRRQTLNLILPGDICGMFLGMGTADPRVALTRLQAIPATIPMELTASERGGDGTASLARWTLAFEQWCVFNQLMRLGAMQAKERMAHLLLELYHRLASVRLAEDFGFELPLTQEQLANLLGLSNVHVNRVLQSLRHEGLIACRGSRVRLLKADDLAGMANFTLPGFLEHRA